MVSQVTSGWDRRGIRQYSEHHSVAEPNYTHNYRHLFNTLGLSHLVCGIPDLLSWGDTCNPSTTSYTNWIIGCTLELITSAIQEQRNARMYECINIQLRLFAHAYTPIPHPQHKLYKLTYILLRSPWIINHLLIYAPINLTVVQVRDITKICLEDAQKTLIDWTLHHHH